MASIQGIYVALFGRPADPAGLAFFNEATNNGADLTAIGDLASTAEYQDRFTGMSSEEIVNSIYQSLFERDGEAEGIQFFVNALANGTYTINNIAIAILDGAQGDDLATVNAKIAAADLFTARLDLDEELEAYFGMDAASIGRGYLELVDADNPADAALADEWILKLFGPDEGQQPGGGGGGGTTPDTTAPIGIVDPLSAGDGTFKAGETITFTVEFDENVVVTGDVVLELTGGAEASYLSGSGTDTIVFTYTVADGEDVADLEVEGLGGTGSLADRAGNAGSVTATTDLDILIDTVVPTGTVNEAESTLSPVSPGSELIFVIDFDEDVAPTGPISLALSGGREATFDSAVGNKYTFTYTVEATDSISDLEVEGLNGTLADAAGNNATVTATTDLDIYLGPDEGEVWVLNPDGDFVSSFDSPTAIHDAIASADAVDGGTILIGHGVYSFNSTITLTKELTILGANHGVDPTDGISVRGPETILKGAVPLTNGAFNIQLSGGDHTDNVTFDGLVFDSFTASGSNRGVILLSGTAVNENLTIVNNVFQGSNIPGVNAQSGTKDYVIQNNVFQNFQSTGYANLSAIEITTSNSGGSQGGLIDSNWFLDILGNGAAGHSHAFILGGGSSGSGNQLNTIISGNLIDGTSASGMRLQGDMNSVQVFENIVRNTNSVESGTDAAIRIQLNNASGPILVFDNEISDSFNAFALTGGGSAGSPIPSIYDNAISDIDGLAFVSFFNRVADYTGVGNTLDGVTIYAVVGSQGMDNLVFAAPGDGSGLYIVGGSGNDTISGTENADIFVFGPDSGVDTINGFADGDKLDVRAWDTDFATLDTNVDGVLDDGDAAVSVLGGNLTLTFAPGNSVTLSGVSALDAADFVS